MGAGAGGKKQREVYVGNLTIGSVNDVMLKELFNGALAHLMPDAATNPPVVNVAMDPSGGHPHSSCAQFSHEPIRHTLLQALC